MAEKCNLATIPVSRTDDLHNIKQFRASQEHSNTENEATVLQFRACGLVRTIYAKCGFVT